MPAHHHPDADGDGHVDAADLVDGVTERRAIKFYYPPGEAYAHRNGTPDEYYVLRVNQSYAFLDTMTVSTAQLLRFVERGVELGGDVDVDRIDTLWPSRFGRGDGA